MSNNCPYILTVPVSGADYLTDGVKVTIDQTKINDWSEIDAVELVGNAIVGPVTPPSSEAPATQGGAQPSASAGQYTSADAAPGNFVFEVVGAGEDKKIDGGFFQDQSTTSEYVVGLMEEGDFARYFLTLFIPHNIAPGTVTLLPYNKSSATQGPGAAIFIGAWYYYADGGTLVVDSMGDDTLTGSFQFNATREDGNGQITVAGAFNQMPLVKK